MKLADRIISSLGFLVEMLYWLQIFLCPAIILGFTSFLVYYNYHSLAGIFFACLIAAIGVASGIYFAERIRRTIGCSIFLSRLISLTGPQVMREEDEWE